MMFTIPCANGETVFKSNKTFLLQSNSNFKDVSIKEYSKKPFSTILKESIAFPIHLVKFRAVIKVNVI